MFKGCLQLSTGFIKLTELLSREAVEVFAIGTNEVTEHRTRDDSVLVMQSVNKALHVFFWIKAKTMHARIKLNMYRPSCDTLFLCSLNKCFQQPERINLWLQIIVEHRLESRHLWIHYHDILGDTMATQRYALVSNGNSQIIYTMVLQRLGHFHSSSSIGIGLHHANQLCFRLHERAIVIQVVDQCVQVDFQNRFMHFLLQAFCDAVEPERTGSLDQYHLIMQQAEDIAAQKFLCCGEEILLINGENSPLGSDVRSDSNKFVNATFLTEIANLSIEVDRRHPTLKNVTENKCLSHFPSEHRLLG